MDEWRSDAGLRWRPLEPFGAEIDGDLNRPLSRQAAEGLVSLLWDHGLILARGQSLTMERQREICALWGPILLRAGENGYLSTVGAAEPSLTELSFHADAAYTRAPFDALSLHALDVVAGASSTRFIDAAAALAALPDDLRAAIGGRDVELISPNFDALGGRTCNSRDPVALKRGFLPAVHINPHNGRRCLWVSELQAARVVGMDWEDSRDLLNAIFDHAYAPEHVYEHKWHTGDLLIWDNIALQHARGPLHGVGKRVLQRVIVGTEGVIPSLPEPA